MREVETGIWHWEAPHPEWAGPENEALRERLAALAATRNEAALGVVSSYAIDDGDRLLLFDPLAVPSEIEELAAGREPVVVLTSPWHERDTRSLVERLGAAGVHATAGRGHSGRGVALGRRPGRWPPLLGRRSAARRSRGTARKIAQRPRPVDRESPCGDRRRHALDFGQGLEIPIEWLPQSATLEQVADGLRSLLELPVEVVLATHGGPTDKAALEHALA